MPVQVSESEDQKVASTGSCSVLRIPLLCPGGGKRCLMGGEAMLPNEKAARGGKRGGCSICAAGHCYAKWAHLLRGTIFCAMIKRWAGMISLVILSMSGCAKNRNIASGLSFVVDFCA